MNGLLLIIPLILIRYGLLAILNKSAIPRAAFFAPLEGGEKKAYYVYQVSNVFLLLYPLFLQIRTRPPLFVIGLVLYIVGCIILVITTVAFVKPNGNGLNTNGIYKISRNPMYVGYFFYYLGWALLVRSIALVVALLIFQVSTHWIILSEERWCVQRFGSEYESYMKKVRRYL